MVEMLGVLAIVGVLSVGGIAGYSQAMSKFKVTKAMDQVQTIITNIRTLYASQRKYSEFDAKHAQAMGILTEESIDGDDGLNPFGGKIYFSTADSDRTFTITYTGLTGEACVKMATADWGADQSSGLRGMGVGTEDKVANKKVPPTHKWENTLASDTTYSGAANTLPVSVASAAELCGTAQNGAVTWYYR